MAARPGTGRRWFLQVFGGYRLKNGARSQPLAPQELFLLVLLAVAAKEVSRSTLIYLMWDSGGERTLRHRLSQVCLSLRRHLGTPDIVLAAGDTLSLNSTLVWTELDEVAHQARTGNSERMMARLDRGFRFPESWMVSDNRIEGWVVRELSHHATEWKRSFEHSGLVFPIATEFNAGEEFSGVVARPKEREPTVETPIHFRTMLWGGLKNERRRGNASGLALVFRLTKDALLQLHPTSPEYWRFLVLFAQRALWAEGTGGGEDALSALEAFREHAGWQTSARDLCEILPVLEVERLLHSPPVARGVAECIRSTLDGQRGDPLEAAARARLELQAHRAGLGNDRMPRSFTLSDTSGGVEHRWLTLEAMARGAILGADRAGAATLFGVFLKEAEAAGDYPAIALATAGLLNLAPDLVPISRVRMLMHRFPGHVHLPRREYCILAEAWRHWTERAGESTVSLSLATTPILQLRNTTDASTPPRTFQPPLRWVDRGHHRRHVFREIRRADAAGATRHDRAKGDPGVQIASG
jgi:hypothetical protein